MDSDQPPTAEAGVPNPAEVQGRAVRLATGAFRPFIAFDRNTGLVLMAGAIVAVVLGLSPGDRLLAIGAGLTVLLVGFIVAWRPLLNPRFRAARELISDHNCHEAAEFKRETGTNMPRGLRACERWIAEHPTSRGRASILLVLGRVAEADEAINAAVTNTSEQAFDVEIYRHTRTMLLGGLPDLGPLHAIWPNLPNRRERRHRRECLAILEAQLAGVRGSEPISVLAQGRHEIDDVYWRYRTAWVLGLILVIAIGLVGFGGLLAASLVE